MTIILVFLFLYIPFLTTNGFQLAGKQNIDLPSVYFASDVTFNEHASPYREGAWNPTQQQLQQKVFPYLYPPPSLLLFLPFSWFSYEGVKTAALIVNHLSLLLQPGFTALHLGRARPPADRFLPAGTGQTLDSGHARAVVQTPL